MRIAIAAVVGFLAAGSDPATGLTPADAGGRLRVAMQIARERNDRSLVASVEKLAREFKGALPTDADARLREIEKAVGIDPGGWSMAGQPLFKPTPEMQARLKAMGPKLAGAMGSGDPAAVRAVTAEMLGALGDQAGVPDGRRPGHATLPCRMSEAQATRLFMEALVSNGDAIRQMAKGKPLPDQMLRIYADLLNATVGIRPFVTKHQPAALGELDGLTKGLVAILIDLQQPGGHFPFPDLRGKNIRFGDMLQRQIDAGHAEVRDGWIITTEPDGGTQFDTGLCGTALLLAGQAHGIDEWKRAGIRAADWALGQPCCANFNYNAFSVSLLAHAFRISGDAKYLDGALRKFRVGVAPGQAPNGRWMDPHNARTVYHVIILRALGDLASVLPAEQRPELDAVARPAIKVLLDEFDAMGVTVEALAELMVLAKLYPDDARLQGAVKFMAGTIIDKCDDGRRVKMGAGPAQIAALADAAALL